MLEENPDTPWLKLNKDLIPPSVDDAIVMDFRNFMYIAMKALGLGEPTQLQYAMGYRLQHGPESFQLQAGRGAGPGAAGPVRHQVRRRRRPLG